MWARLKKTFYFSRQQIPLLNSRRILKATENCCYMSIVLPYIASQYFCSAHLNFYWLRQCSITLGLIFNFKPQFVKYEKQASFTTRSTSFDKFWHIIPTFNVYISKISDFCTFLILRLSFYLSVNCKSCKFLAYYRESLFFKSIKNIFIWWNI